jgi:hypothetical protein
LPTKGELYFSDGYKKDFDFSKLGCTFEFDDQQVHGPHETKSYNAHLDSF